MVGWPLGKSPNNRGFPPTARPTAPNLGFRRPAPRPPRHRLRTPRPLRRRSARPWLHRTRQHLPHGQRLDLALALAQRLPPDGISGKLLGQRLFGRLTRALFLCPRSYSSAIVHSKPRRRLKWASNIGARKDES